KRGPHRYSDNFNRDAESRPICWMEQFNRAMGADDRCYKRGDRHRTPRWTHRYHWNDFNRRRPRRKSNLTTYDHRPSTRRRRKSFNEYQRHQTPNSKRFIGRADFEPSLTLEQLNDTMGTV